MRDACKRYMRGRIARAELAGSAEIGQRPALRQIKRGVTQDEAAV